jgi:putative transposase
MGIGRYELSDVQWEQIKDLRSGARWRDLPERYGKYKSVHKRFIRWTNSGVWEKVFHEIVRDRKNQYLMIDSTIVRAHQQAATGRKKGVRTRLWGVPEEV